jgi:GGDEF domain-containing protein
LHAKAIERLQKILQLYPGEEQRNGRLRHLCELTNWWPAGAAPVPTPALDPAAAPAQPSYDQAGGMRDLAKISEISQSLLRLPSAKAVLNAAVNEIGRYLHVARCIAVIGTPGKPPQMAAEFCGPGIESAASAMLVRLLAQIEHAVPDAQGTLSLQALSAPVLGELGLDSVLGVVLNDPEAGTQAGMVVAGSAVARNWRAGEGYFLQAVGDQVLLVLNHLRLRTLARTLGAADEKTGLLGRSSYQDYLLSETHSAKSKGTALSVALVQIDRGPELLRHHGETEMEHHLEQLAGVLQPMIRQCDYAVKYTSWTIAFILPDTTLAGAEVLAQKLRGAGTQVQPSWDPAKLTLSASVAEAVIRPNFDGEDIVTELMNRVVLGLEEAEHRGGDRVVTV